MNGIARAALLAGLLLGMEVAAAQTAPAVEATQGPNTVIEVRVEGNQAMSGSAVLVDVKTRPGQPYNEQVVRDDEQRLLKTRRYDNVRTTRTQTERGVVVTFIVAERPLVRSVEIRGAKSVKESELRKLLTFGAGDPLDRYQVEASARAIEGKYHGSGYPEAKVSFDEARLAQGQAVFEVVEGQKLYVKKVQFRFTGPRSFPDAKLKGIVKTKARLWPLVPGALDLETIDRDVVDLRNFYRDEGFLDVQVSREVSYLAQKQRAVVSYLIEEGPRFRIRNVVFKGNVVFDNEQLARQVRLAPGLYFNGLILRRDTDRIRNLYGELGFINGTVASDHSFTNQPAEVDVVFQIDEGGQFRVGRVEIRGNDNTKMNVIRREINIRPGQFYNTVAVDESRKDLLESQLFDKVTVTAIGGQPDVRDSLWEVQEAKTGQLLVGAGVSSNAGLMGTVSYTERNFDLFAWPGTGRKPVFKGAGQTFRITAEPGTEFSRFRIDLREPSLMDGPYSVGGGLFGFNSQRESYDETRYGAIGSLGRKFPNRWYGELGGRIEGIAIDGLDHDAPHDVRDVEGANFLVGLKGTVSRDRTDSRWLPSTGDRLSLSYEQVGGDFVFGRPTGDYHIYRTVHRDALDRKHILAGRASAGYIVGDSPMFERFYGGGLGSVRGFKYRGISPRQGPRDEPVVGDFMAFLGGEYTFPLIAEVVRGVVFLDSGTVEREASIETWRVAAGFGVRLHIPFFGPVPMSLDFGLPLNKDEQDETQLVSFSFGWVF